MARGRLIALEGIDGCGKSTQAGLLAGALGALLTHEPGGSPLGSVLRSALLGSPDATMSPRAEALLMAADRAQHVAEVLEPALASGRWVVTDRYSASTLAYQGYGRGLDLAELRALVSYATDGLEPDLSILVDVPLAVGRARRAGSDPDRLERLDDRFHARVHHGYHELAAASPARFAVVDGTGTVDEVAALVAGVVRARLGPPPSSACAVVAP